MTGIKDDRTNRRGNAGTVRTLDERSVPDRRRFLRLMAMQGVSVPAAYFMLANDGSPVPAAKAQDFKQVNYQKGALRPADNIGESSIGGTRLIRDFSDPYIELIRLLHEASEVEHALMVQYLYGAFSLKPEYGDVRGHGAPNTDDLLGVAVQEMQHLGMVNKLLVELGAAPSLMRQDFPYEPDIYPFEFNLEPLSRKSLAKYLYTEAPAGALKWSNAKTPEDRAFLTQLKSVIGANTKPNHVGSFYDEVLRTIDEVEDYENKQRTLLDPIDLKKWKQDLVKLKMEGEVGHYRFFKNLFLGEHEGFKAHHADVWSLPAYHPAYPSLSLPVNPSAYVGHPNQIADPTALSMAWLGNLHYWTILFSLNLAYHTKNYDYMEPARQHMMGPFMVLAKYLPTIGAGMPFDPLSMGYAPGREGKHSLYVLSHMIMEAGQLERKLKNHLPEDYPFETTQASLEQISEISVATRK